jgi:hypothetical protein
MKWNIHCILRWIKQTENEFETVLNWIVLQQGADGWRTFSTRTLKGKGSCYYASLDPKCQEIVEKCDVAEVEDEYFIGELLWNCQNFQKASQSDYLVSRMLSLLTNLHRRQLGLKQERTLHAFGYVSASKKENKFILCSPDLGCAMNCESTKHLFIYKGQYDTASGLRKRSGQQSLIGQEKSITFDWSNGEILGISVENDVALLLTNNSILCLQMAIEEYWNREIR